MTTVDVRSARRHPALGWIASLAVLAGTPLSLADDDWSDRVWDSARVGLDCDALRALLIEGVDGDGAALKDSITLFNSNLDKRETSRAEQITKVGAELDEHLAKLETPGEISKALKAGVELYMLSTDKASFVADERTKRLESAAVAAARAAEEAGDLLAANELFFRLDALFEEQGTYKPDVERLGHRLGIIRLYTPERFWTMRNDRRLADGEDPLPPYNPTKDDFHDKLAGVNEAMLRRALSITAGANVDRVRLADMLRGGVQGVLTLATTTGLEAAFPGLGDANAKELFVSRCQAELARIDDSNGADLADLDLVLSRLQRANSESVSIDPIALMHEFGNGAMTPLDDFSAIIWPDEIRNFRRTTQGSIVGIGVQIQLDPTLSKILVVTPLEGTPAHRAGISAGDVITSINGVSTAGFTLDQAVDTITGPVGTKVSVAVEREDEGAKRELAFDVPRAVIDIPTVKGWRRAGAREDQWDWFVDPEHSIGYVRLTQFTEKTDAEFDAAVDQMKAQGLAALIVDLRFNPGGLLDQAVSISNRFIDSGLIVATKDGADKIQDQEFAQRTRATLKNVPVVVLVNEGSASASEIVSGAVQYYGKKGEIDAIVVGERSFGKGSVQKVWDLARSEAAVKVTTQYYLLPDRRVIHRTPGASSWGINPEVRVEMLPDQITDALNLRRDADIVPIAGAEGKPRAEPIPNPDDLIAKGTDLQLNAAVVLLQTQTIPAKTTAERGPR